MAKARLPGEFELIERYFAPLAAGVEGAYGLANDAARLALQEGQDLVVTEDLMVAGVHFLPDEEAGFVGRRLLRVNLSDLAAMGAAPVGYLVGLALPKETEPSWVEAFASGLKSDQERFGLSLLGGDTVATPGPLTLSLTALGSAPRGSELTRSGARPGDWIYVSGTIGDGALGLAALEGRLAALSEGEREGLIARYRLPEPRLDLGRRLVGLAGAALDISDGLVADLGHICTASGVGARVEAESVPLSPGARAALEADGAFLAMILSGGDDYELVFTAAEAEAARVEAAARACGVALSPIGRIEEGSGVSVVDAEGRSLRIEHEGYRHF